MVDWPAGTEGVVGGELRDGGSFGHDWGICLRWLPIKIELGVDSHDEERASGEESGEGEALVAPE